MDKSKRRKKPPTTLNVANSNTVDIPGKKANKDSSLDTTLKKTDGKLFILMVSFTMFEKRLMLTQQIIKMTVTGKF